MVQGTYTVQSLGVEGSGIGAHGIYGLRVGPNSACSWAALPASEAADFRLSLRFCRACGFDILGSQVSL